LDPKIQNIARDVLQKGLIEYDRRHGWRGALDHVKIAGQWLERFKLFKKPDNALERWKIAMVTKVDPDVAEILLQDLTIAYITVEHLKWARKHDPKANRATGPKIVNVGQVLNVGDVILVEASNASDNLEDEKFYQLRQIPQINGAIIVLDPHTGRVLAMVGGWKFSGSQFNRASQALRQPGSAFKPFVYLAALEDGYSPATLILDAPFALPQGKGKKRWKPANFTNVFYGLSPMQLGIEKSRNLMTVRLADKLGMEKITHTAKIFNIDENMPQFLSMSLGAGETTLKRMTAAYAMLVNGGRKIKPTLLDRIQERHGKTIYRADQRICEDCNGVWNFQKPPQLKDHRARLVDRVHAYQIVSMLEGVVKRGTGRRLRQLKIPLAGKTGTTNENRDSWFIGFSPDIAVGVYTGFDLPRSLGFKPDGVQETGSTVALPIFYYFMEEFFKDHNVVPFRIPDGVEIVRMDIETMQLATTSSQKVQLMPFHKDRVPNVGDVPVIVGGGTTNETQNITQDSIQIDDGLY
ncbi:MAG: penicillin-binding transpeptidase domain-containing protein, partial [Pseudomonadota bacterium]